MAKEEKRKEVQKVIAKAWADDAFKQKLLSDPASTLKKEGLELPPGVEVRVVECTDDVYYLVLPPKPADGELDVDQVDSIEAAFYL
jgi:hypothetical protein